MSASARPKRDRKSCSWHRSHGGAARFLQRCIWSLDVAFLQMDFIHRFIPAPEHSDRVLLLLHGTGGDENDMIPIGRDLDPAAAVLSLRGNVLENGMPRFFRRL